MQSKDKPIFDTKFKKVNIGTRIKAAFIGKKLLLKFEKGEFDKCVEFLPFDKRFQQFHGIVWDVKDNNCINQLILLRCYRQ